MPTLADRQGRHVLYTWTAQSAAKPISIESGEGACFFDSDGNRWLDFESQVFNCNVGHGQTRIAEAIAAQAHELACAHPAAVYETKARLAEKLAAITPGDLNQFFFCLSGSEAVENAYKMARLLTGRKKVIARRRSYHGASMGALSLTGDPRRWPLEPGLWGVLRAEDPYCYRCPYGLSPDTCGMRCAEHIEHIIEMEGADSIAAVIMEGVTGTNGGFIPPAGYWPRVREICDRHGILLIADEVFSGFGRTGTWFAVEHWGVVPDMITMAKGLTGGYAPMGAVAIRDDLAKKFQDETLWCGLTGYAHPIACAAADAAIDVYRDQGMLSNTQQRGLQLAAALDDLAQRFSFIGDVRNLGLFGTMEFIKPGCGQRVPLKPYPQSGDEHSWAGQLRRGLRERHIHIAQKWTHLFIAPPLCITEAELGEGMKLIADALADIGEPK